VADYLDVAEARSLPGLRLVLPPGVPGPWGEGAKGLFDVKGIPYARVRQVPGDANADLVAWTGHANAPQAIHEREPARTAWTEIVLLAEHLAPTPALLPVDPEQRALAFGLGFEICGEQGFGWQRRLMMFDAVLSLPQDILPEAHPARRMVAGLGRRYGYSPAAAAAAPERAAAILAALARRLETQRAQGSRYLVGDRLSAIDVYWAAFAAMISPLDESLCAMPAMMRSQYELDDPSMRAAATGLLEHRDFVYREHLVQPLDL
jgi:glutathione S-transferase